MNVDDLWQKVIANKKILIYLPELLQIFYRVRMDLALAAGFYFECSVAVYDLLLMLTSASS
jgi:hypothetical protein